MDIFLYVEVAAQVPYTYQHPHIERLKSRFPEIIVYDCDNHSEAMIIQAAADLLEKSIHAFVWIHASGGELGKIRLLVEKIIQHSGQIRVYYSGSQVTLDRLLQALPAEKLLRSQEENIVWNWIEGFYAKIQ